MSLETDLGSGLAFPFCITGAGIKVASGEEKVAQALMMLLQTQFGERLMRPTYGANLRSLAFAPLDVTTCRTAERLCRNAIGAWEPRVSIVSITVTPDNAASGSALIIDLAYRIAGNPVEQTLTLSTPLEPMP